MLSTVLSLSAASAMSEIIRHNLRVNLSVLKEAPIILALG